MKRATQERLFDDPFSQDIISQTLAAQPLLRRTTDIAIPHQLFKNTSFMMNLGHAAKWGMDIRPTNPDKKTEKLTRKPTTETTIDDVVTEILKVSHRDLHDAELTLLIHATHDFYHFFRHHSIHDPDRTQQLRERSLPLKNTDLLRGMDVFIEVANDRYDYVYDADILQPARRLATWIMTIEPTSKSFRDEF